jgi:hypothetical protein
MSGSGNLGYMMNMIMYSEERYKDMKEGRIV